MGHLARRLFPYILIATLAAGVAWSMASSNLPPADFTFVNGTEVQSIDPARVTGSPEGRIISSLFEGLYRPDPKTLEPKPGVAYRHEISKDGKVYTFYLRRDPKDQDAQYKQEAAKNPDALAPSLWSDGTPVTAEDFRFSWQRMLHPDTGSEYTLLLGECVVGAEKYNSPKAKLELGDRVEIELADRRIPEEPFPRGTLLKGKLLAIDKPPKPKVTPGMSSDERDTLQDKWERKWVYGVKVGEGTQKFSQDPPTGDPQVKKCAHVLLDFEEVGIKALDKFTLQVTLTNPTPYFLYLAEFFPLYPVQRGCVEKYGYPNWTKRENIVCNGAYLMEFRRVRDRIRLQKNPLYWDANHVQVKIADALAVESTSTGLNMYLNNLVDWTESPPTAVIPILKKRPDYYAVPSLTISFYRINVTCKNLDNPLVRRALNLAVDKQTLCDNLLRAGQLPARSFVPPGLPGYKPALCDEFNVAEAQRLLKEAGFPDGKGLDKLEILFNSSGEHEKIARSIGGNWDKFLGVRVDYRPLEWGSYLATIDEMKYEVSRSGWTGDYPDPNTFLGLFVSDGAQNSTGWKNAQYDRLIKSAAGETNPQRRLQLFHDAEAILMRELPIIPLWYATNVNMVKPYVKGFYSNSQNVHPIRDLTIDEAARRANLQREKAP